MCSIANIFLAAGSMAILSARWLPPTEFRCTERDPLPTDCLPPINERIKLSVNGAKYFALDKQGLRGRHESRAVSIVE